MGSEREQGCRVNKIPQLSRSESGDRKGPKSEDTQHRCTKRCESAGFKKLLHYTSIIPLSCRHYVAS
jgi:hypothetical protein